MKNHWLNRKLDKEIDKACEGAFLKVHYDEPEHLDLCSESIPLSDADIPEFIDLSESGNTESRYKEYDRSLEEFEQGIDENEKAVVRELLLKHKDDKAWLNEVLLDIVPPQPICVSQSTVSGDLLPTSLCVDNGGLPLDGFTITCSTNAPGFPQDDANSLTQWSSGDANLDIFYSSQFVQNEEMQVHKHSPGRATYLAIHTPILSGTMSGTITWDDYNTFTFTVGMGGEFSVKRQEKGFGIYDNEIDISDPSLNCTTGELVFSFSNTFITPKVIASYEYNLGE